MTDIHAAHFTGILKKSNRSSHRSFLNTVGLAAVALPTVLRAQPIQEQLNGEVVDRMEKVGDEPCRR